LAIVFILHVIKSELSPIEGDLLMIGAVLGHNKKNFNETKKNG